MRALRWTFATSRAWATASTLLAGYTLVFLVLTRAIAIGEAAGTDTGGLPTLVVAPDIGGHALSWLDPAFVLYLAAGIVVAPSVPALLTALVVGTLLGTSGAVALETSIRRPAACVGGSPLWLVASLPSFLVSFSCCAPTVLLLLGASAASATVAIVPFLAPASALALAASLAWTLRRLEPTVAAQGTGGPARMLVQT